MNDHKLKKKSPIKPLLTYLLSFYNMSSSCLVQVAVRSQRGRAMLRVCQWLASTVQNVKQSLLLLVTQGADLSLRAVKCCCSVVLA